MTTPARRPRTGRPGAAVLIAVCLAGCFPAFDWRESRPQGSGATLLFPCRPDAQERSVQVGSIPLRIQMHSCKAGGFTFSLAFADVAEPLQVAPALLALRRSAIDNVGGTAAALPLPAIAGATPNPESRFLGIEGRFPDGRPVVVRAAFFVKGLKVYQATIVGPREQPAGESPETFFSAIRLS